VHILSREHVLPFSGKLCLTHTHTLCCFSREPQPGVGLLFSLLTCNRVHVKFSRCNSRQMEIRSMRSRSTLKDLQNTPYIKLANWN
jgi:hypothetical protein